ncbi:Sensor histidine kinase YpdA [compost metagenome]
MDVSVSLDRRDEFGEFSRTLDLMVRKIANLMDDREEANELKRRLEIQVLQSQINPHFLYNTLGSIGNVIGLGYYDKVDPIIRSLINILEYGIADAAEKVTLRDELNNVHDYILIQNIRYNKQFVIVEKIDPELYDFPVFRMLLQPIVENSLFHGYNGGQLSGEMIIAAFRDNGLTVIQVEDQGVGMSEDKAAELLIAGEKKSGSRMRIGLRNIHQRIQLYFGESYGLKVYSEQGKGTCIRAEFPSDLSKEESN